MLILSKIFGYLPTHTYFFGHGRFFASMCRSWREACLACIFKSVEVNTEAKSLATAALQFGYGDLVKHARIDFSSEDIFEGLALTVLTSGPFKDGVFPFVHET
ncbi:hypothetical protein DL89DRAFT_59469 [Linderina pennispora]|uniref:Uncharacterized protein n=1 Tax=Linderina pennispora TaxID=61395 RepID=A0A1Y1VZT5_9FUNG|nr:uncharacterized protein DL89DRAFT_59469 [Linderina pennispora]ORX66763.1 hypothetical protein DL89DRAFT_59469 [Linderina pennispora]